ncbi:MAG: N-acetyl-gamma-glutamyl-phosphate reductase [Candidatus Omnitrophica bacterium]|nr:N-acetyl-gamma-glutamyl-phosphate reductase [Candidatus Omnitrophota bacterium]
MIKIGVVGATGYTGEELVEVLLKNTEVEITSLSALVEKEVPFSELYPRFGKKISLKCKNLNVDDVAKKCDLVFLALPHTVSMKIAPLFIKKGKKVIDLSADYRLKQKTYEKWYGAKHTDADNLKSAVYGLPEINREKIKKADFVANPGCYPTSVILGLLPIAKLAANAGLEVIADSKSAVTGAGRKALVSLSFGEVDENFKCYKANEHQHIPEMEYISSGVAGKKMKINFIPHLLPVKRGILTTMYIKHKDLPSEKEMYGLYENCFKNEPFVRLRPCGEMPSLQDAAGTNFCDIGIKVARKMVIIVSVIDNLLKGASGQAVQNMNIMYGINEKNGLL